MSKQIQIRRGTATEHASFTGAIGEITMDTTNKTIRVHDGTTAGGTMLAKKSEIPEPYTMPENYDFVIDSQLPTFENNYTWYRKYKSGWIEMGGKASINSINNTLVNLPKEMADTSYFVHTQALLTGSTIWDRIITQTTTGFTIEGDYTNAQHIPVHTIFWTAMGVAAQD